MILIVLKSWLKHTLISRQTQCPLYINIFKLGVSFCFIINLSDVFVQNNNDHSSDYFSGIIIMLCVFEYFRNCRMRIELLKSQALTRFQCCQTVSIKGHLIVQKLIGMLIVILHFCQICPYTIMNELVLDGFKLDYFLEWWKCNVVES